MRTAPLFIIILLCSVVTGIYVFGGMHMLPWVGQAQLPVEDTHQTGETLPTLPIAREEVLNIEQAIARAQELDTSGSRQEALALLLEMENKGNKSVELSYAIGDLFAKQSQYDKSATYFQDALDVQAGHVPTLLSVLHMHLVLENYEAFAQLYATVPTTVSERIYYQGLYLLFMGKEQEAYTLFKEVARNEAVPRKFRSAGDQLVSSFDEFHLYTGGSAVHLRTIISRSLIEGGELVLAERMLRTVIEEKNDYVDGWILLGYTYYLQMKYDLAFTAFDTAYTLDAINPDIQFYLGITKEKLKQYSEALQYLALAEENGYQPVIEITRRMADIYVEIEQYEQAVALYEEVLQLEETKDLARYIRPLWLYIDLLERPNDAMRLAEQAMQTHPNDAMANNLLGWSYLARKDYVNAEKYLLQALSLDRSLPAAYLNLGKLYEETNKREYALTFYQRAYVMGEGTSVGNTAAQLYNALIQ